MKMPVREFKLMEILSMALPVTAAMSNYLLPFDLGIGFLYGFRYLVMLMFIFMIFKMFINGFGWHGVSRFAKLSIAIMSIWVIWGISSCLWAPDHVAAMKEVAGLIFGLALILIFIIYFKMNYRLINNFHYSWIFGLAVSGLIAVWEIYTGNHLIGYWSDNNDSLSKLIICSSTFDNPNNYAAYILLGFPIILWSIRKNKNIWIKSLLVFFLIWQSIMLGFTGSRIAMVGAIIVLCLYYLVCFNMFKGLMAILFTVILIFKILPFIENQESLSIVQKLEHRQTLLIDSSGEERLNIQKDGLWMLQKTYGLGVGAGGFTSTIKYRAVPYPVRAFSPHNFVNEIVSQYGIIIGILLTYLFLKLFFLILRAKKMSASTHSVDSLLLFNTYLMEIVAFLFAMFCGSSLLMQPTIWLLFVIWIIMGSYSEKFICLTKNLRDKTWERY